MIKYLMIKEDAPGPFPGTKETVYVLLQTKSKNQELTGYLGIDKMVGFFSSHLDKKGLRSQTILPGRDTATGRSQTIVFSSDGDRLNSRRELLPNRANLSVDKSKRESRISVVGDHRMYEEIKEATISYFE